MQIIQRQMVITTSIIILLSVSALLTVIDASASMPSAGQPAGTVANMLVITPTLASALPPGVASESTLRLAESPALAAESATYQNLVIPDKQTLVQVEAASPNAATSNDWLNWLLTAQHGYGSWGDPGSTEVRDTSEVAQTYRWLGLAGTSMQAAGNWAEQLSTRNLDYLARQILTMLHAGEEISDLDDQLIAMQNGDGGFGFRASHGSDPLSTLVALQALEVAGHHIGTPQDDVLISAILYYLMASQAAEGGWGYTSQDQSRVVMTALVLESLRPYRGYTITGAQQFVVQTEINQGLTWLKGRQNTDGGWGENGSTVYQTAMASMAILNLRDQPTNLSDAQSYLVNAQQPDGSWSGDAFTTAVAKRALSAFPWGIRNDNGAVASAFNGWRAGYMAASIFYPDSMTYPIQVKTGTFWLYNFAGVSSVTVRIRLYAVTPDMRLTLLAITSPFAITSPWFYPNSITVDFSGANILIHSPDNFMVAVEYMDGSAGSTPSIINDSSTNIPTYRNIYSPDGGANWYDHYGFWPAFGINPATKGHNLIRASIQTNVPIPLPVQGISGQTGTAQAQRTVLSPDTRASQADNSVAASNDLILSWSGVSTDSKGRYVKIDHYNVYRSTSPYFVPTQFNLYGISFGTTFTDPGVLGNPDVNYFYVVTAVDSNGVESAVSGRIGEVEFNIQPGAGPTSLRWTSIALPLNVTGITTADQVAAYISPAGSIKKVARWDAISQTWVVRNVGALLGTPNFAVSVGSPLLVAANDSAPTRFAWVGQVPERGAVSYTLVPGETAVKWNFVALPFDQEDLTTADALASGIGGVTRVARWDATTQTWIVRNVGSMLAGHTAGRCSFTSETRWRIMAPVQASQDPPASGAFAPVC